MLGSLGQIGDPIDNFGDNLESRKRSDNMATLPVIAYTKLINDPYLTREQRCLISNMITQWKD